jgi:hypothetical protein
MALQPKTRTTELFKAVFNPLDALSGGRYSISTKRAERGNKAGAAEPPLPGC